MSIVAFSYITIMFFCYFSYAHFFIKAHDLIALCTQCPADFWLLFMLFAFDNTSTCLGECMHYLCSISHLFYVAFACYVNLVYSINHQDR